MDGCNEVNPLHPIAIFMATGFHFIIIIFAIHICIFFYERCSYFHTAAIRFFASFDGTASHC